MSVLTYIIYILLFLALILEPHLIQGHVKGISPAFAGSFFTLIIIAIAGGVHWLHKKDIKRREQARQQALQKLEISTEKLNDAFKYIGLVNQHLPLLNQLTTDLLAHPNGSKNDKKEIFQELLATAVVSLTGADWGIFRFIDITTEHTVKEFIFTAKETWQPSTPISNHVLVALRNSGERIKKVSNHFVLSTTHTDAPIQCHYIFPLGKFSIQENENILQNIVDQTQLLYKYLYQ